MTDANQVKTYAQFGRFGHGFWAAGLNSAIGGGDLTQNAVANVLISAVIGGTISKVTGGKFANGASSAAFSAALRQDWSSPPKEGSAAWEAREEAAFLKQDKEMQEALFSGGKDILASNNDYYFTYSFSITGVIGDSGGSFEASLSISLGGDVVVGLEGAHMTDGGGLFFGVDHGAGAGWNQKGLNATPWSSGTSLRGAFALSRGGVINISPGDGYFNFSAGRIKYVPAGIGSYAGKFETSSKLWRLW